MSLLVVGQAKSSGATTTALALAASWTRPCVLVEADPSGGDLAARAGHPLVPGLLSLVAAGRGRILSMSLLSEHIQLLGGVVPALVGPPGAGPAGTARVELEERFDPGFFVTDDVNAIVDVGRIGPEDGRSVLLAAADLVVLVARPDPAGAAHLSALLGAISSDLRSRVAVVLVGSAPYGPDEVAGVLGVEVTGALAWDPRGAESLGAGVVSGFLAERSALRRSARALAPALAARLGECPPTNGSSILATLSQHEAGG